MMHGAEKGSGFEPGIEFGDRGRMGTGGGVVAEASAGRGEKGVLQHVRFPHAQEGLDAAGQRRDDGRGDLVLDREDVVELALATLRPDMGIIGGIDELHGDADAAAGFPDAALDRIPGAEHRGQSLFHPSCPLDNSSGKQNLATLRSVSGSLPTCRQWRMERGTLPC